MKIEEKEIQLMEYLLQQENFLNYKVIAEHFNVTQRVIRYSLKKINTYLKENGKEEIVVHPKKGVMITKKAEVSGLLQSFNEKTTPDTYRYSPEEMEQFILMKLLLSEDPVAISFFEEVLYSSRTTVLRHLEKIKNDLNGTRLQLVHAKRKGFYIDGNPLDVNGRLTSIFMDKVNVRELYAFVENNGYVFSKKMELILFNLFDIDTLEKAFNIEKKIEENKRQRDDFYTIFVTFLVYTILVEKPSWTLEDYLLKNKNTEDSKEKLLWMVINEETDNYNREINLIKEQVDELVNEVASHYHYDSKMFSEDFRTQLSLHVSNLISRVRRGIVEENQIFNDILKDYPELFQLLKSKVSLLEEPFKIKVQDQELSFIVIYFASEIEKLRIREQNKLSVLVVCVEGIAISKLIRSQLLNYFEFEKVDTSSLKNFSKKNLQEYDYVVTTVNIPDIQSPKIIKIKNYLKRNDIEQLKQIFTTKELKKDTDNLKKFNQIMTLIEENTNGVTNLGKLEMELIKVLSEKEDERRITHLPSIDFSDENITIVEDKIRWETALDYGTFGLQSINATTEEYRESILRNIRMHGLYMIVAPKVMIAHAGMDDGVLKSAMWLTILKKGTNLQGNFQEDVQLIFTIAFKNEKSHKIMENIAQLVSNPNKIDDLIEKTDKKEIFAIIESEIYNY